MKTWTYDPGPPPVPRIPFDMEKAERTLRSVIDAVVRKDWAALEEITGGVRASAQEIDESFDDVVGPCTFLPFPDDEYADLIYEPIDSRVYVPQSGRPAIHILECHDPGEWAVDVDLRTEEEGGDIGPTLQITLLDASGDFYRVEFDNLHYL